jgi:hypothetical protein
MGPELEPGGQRLSAFQTKAFLPADVGDAGQVLGSAPLQAGVSAAAKTVRSRAFQEGRAHAATEDQMVKAPYNQMVPQRTMIAVPAIEPEPEPEPQPELELQPGPATAATEAALALPPPAGADRGTGAGPEPIDVPPPVSGAWPWGRLNVRADQRGEWYYYNHETGETRWEVPEGWAGGDKEAIAAEARFIKREVRRMQAERRAAALAAAPPPQPQPEPEQPPAGEAGLDKALSFRTERPGGGAERPEAEAGRAAVAAAAAELVAEEAAEDEELRAQIEEELRCEAEKRLAEARAARAARKSSAAASIQSRYRGRRERSRGRLDRAAATIQARQRGRVARRRGAPMQASTVGGHPLDSGWSRRFLARLGPDGTRSTRARRHLDPESGREVPAREWLRAQVLPPLREVLRAHRHDAQPPPPHRLAAAAPASSSSLGPATVSKASGGVSELAAAAAVPAAESDPVHWASRALRRMADPELEWRTSVQATFSQLDADGDGTISIDEIGGALVSMGCNPSFASVQAMLKEVDQDSDGRVSFDEFLMMARASVATGSARGEPPAQDEATAAAAPPERHPSDPEQAAAPAAAGSRSPNPPPVQPPAAEVLPDARAGSAAAHLWGAVAAPPQHQPREDPEHTGRPRLGLAEELQATFEFISALRPSVHAAMTKLAQHRPPAVAESLTMLADYMEAYTEDHTSSVKRQPEAGET